MLQELAWWSWIRLYLFKEPVVVSSTGCIVVARFMVVSFHTLEIIISTWVASSRCSKESS